MVRSILLLLLAGSLQADIPPEAYQHRTTMIKSAWRVFGPGAPIATLAAQIHQESAWKINAVSWAGAQGFAQFMPATAKDMAKRFPQECAPANPFSPQWAFNCRDRYLQTLLVKDVDECSSWAFGLRSYNGGKKWVNRDRNLALMAGADPNDWQAVDGYNSGRSFSAFRENTEYPKKIFMLESRYLTWGDGLQCNP